MGRASTKENRTIYQISRENKGWSRAKAAEETYISESRIEKIEGGRTKAVPEDIVTMADCYGAPELCNYYCTRECAIGEKINVPEVEEKGLAKIVLELLNTLNSLNREKDRLVEIAEDEKITDDELKDFVKIQEELDRISNTVNSLKLWIAKQNVK